MRLVVVWSVYFLFQLSQLFFPEEVIIPKEITDPMKINNPYSFERFLNKTNPIDRERTGYLTFKQSFLSKLDFAVGLEEFKAIGGTWSLSTEPSESEEDFFLSYLQNMRVIVGNHEKLFIRGNHHQVWVVFKYGEYYIIDMTIPESIGPLLLFNIQDDSGCFYTLINGTWKLLSFQRDGDHLFKRQRFSIPSIR